MKDPSELLLQNREFRRLYVYSGIGHLLLLIVVSVSFSLDRTISTPAPIFVELVQASELAPAPAPKLAKQQVEQPVVIPERAPEPKPKAKPEPRVEPKPEPKPKPKVAEPERPSAQQLLAQLRAKLAATAPSEPLTGTAGGGRGRFDPQLARYQKKVFLLLRSNWVGARMFKSEPDLEVHYKVRIDGGGGIRSVDLVRSSGNRYYDESAERAIQKSRPFPDPPRGPLTLDVTFQPTSVF